MLVSELITLSLNDLGVYGVGRTPSGPDMALGLNKFILMLDTLKAVRLSIFRLQRTTYSVVANTQSYTIGSGGTWNGFRPQNIERAGFINSSQPTMELPVHVDTDEEWAETITKSLTGNFPTNLWYDRNYPLGVIWLWPLPTQAGTMVLYVPTPVTTTPTLATDLSLPPGYLEMYVANLNLRLAGPFRRPVDQDMRNMANNSLRIVATSNSRGAKMNIPSQAKTFRFVDGRYNILTDTYGGN